MYETTDVKNLYNSKTDLCVKFSSPQVFMSVLSLCFFQMVMESHHLSTLAKLKNTIILVIST
jgi:hypothetical protein